MCGIVKNRNGQSILEEQDQGTCLPDSKICEKAMAIKRL